MVELLPMGGVNGSYNTRNPYNVPKQVESQSLSFIHYKKKRVTSMAGEPLTRPRVPEC